MTPGISSDLKGKSFTLILIFNPFCVTNNGGVGVVSYNVFGLLGCAGRLEVSTVKDMRPSGTFVGIFGMVQVEEGAVLPPMYFLEDVDHEDNSPEKATVLLNEILFFGNAQLKHSVCNR